ncbi:MAG TPA: DUF4886 domain-containing protein [Firmicutes bacterium]|nr:DUF4886 domain-containing protein [Bacillota bacterium]
MRKFARTLSAALLSGCLLAGTAAPGFSALAADTELPVWPKNDTLKVLAIGNSFSEDAMRWMYDIALDCGAEDVVFANLYIGGCSLERHVSNIQNDSKAYDYQRISKETGGVWKHSGGTEDPWSISQGLQEEDWDYITIQQVSGYSGDPASFKKGDTDYIDEMVNYIRKYNTTAKIGYHMTWAYQQDSNHGDFGKYNKDQMTMYNAILSTVQNTVLAEHPEIDFVVPAGTTIQNLRTSFLGDTLTRDGYHMSYNLGRYAVGLTWILKIAGWSIDDVTFTPSAAEVPASYLPMIKEAVKNAVANPWEVTRSSYLSGPFYNDYGTMVELDIKSGATPFAYWQSDHSGRFNRPVTEDGNSNQFVATRQFTKLEIPVGSVIELDEGYQYRPDAWVDPGQRNPNRPGTVSSSRVVVDEGWWGDFTVRGFNVAKKGNPALSEDEAADILNHIHIYVPVMDMSGYKLLDLKTTGTDSDGNPGGATEGGYWNTGDANGHSNLWTTNDNSKQFVATGLLTEEDMPVGSIIEVDAGWQYRPERWINFGEQQQNRPDNSKASRTIVDESWWDPYTLRAFNISTTDAADLTGRLDEALAHFRIYVPVGESDQNLIESIAFTTLPVESCVFGDNTIDLTLSESWSITSLAPDITISDKATISPDPSIPQDFSQPVKYTVTAENGDTREYTISISMPISSEAEIKSFTLAGYEGIIDGDKISVTVPYGTDLSALAPEIEISHNATISPAPDEVQDFRKRVQYTVTAEDGSTTAVYTVQADKAGMPAALEEARGKAVDCLKGMEAANETTADEILDAVAEAIGNAEITLSWTEPFQLTPATEEAEGSITGSIRLNCEGAMVNVPVQITIDRLTDPLQAAGEKAEALLGSMEVTNETTADEILDAVAEAIGNAEITLSWTEPFQLTPATEEAEGSITGTICLKLADRTLDVDLDMVIDRLPDSEVTKGDFDGNGKVDITDIMSACRVLARQNTGSEPSPEELAVGDLTGDNKMGIEDVMAMCRILARNGQ